MSSFDKILAQFSKQGYNENSYLLQNQVNQAMDIISVQNTGLNQFDRSIAEEFWSHCQPDPVRGVRLYQYINTIIEAQNILRQQSDSTQKALQFQKQPEKRAELQQQWKQIFNDHKSIVSLFRLPLLKQSSQNENFSSLKNPNEKNRQGDSTIFGYESNTRQQSSMDLKICLFVALISFVWQLIIMFTKHHFLTLLCICCILSIYFLNYFDRAYIKFLLIFIVVTIIFDLVWLGINARQYWNPNSETQHSTLQNIFLVVVFWMVIILIVFRIVMFGILVKYRDNGEQFRKNVSVIGYRIKLDGRPEYNPFRPVLSKSFFLGNN